MRKLTLSNTYNSVGTTKTKLLNRFLRSKLKEKSKLSRKKKMSDLNLKEVKTLKAYIWELFLIICLNLNHIISWKIAKMIKIMISLKSKFKTYWKKILQTKVYKKYLEDSHPQMKVPKKKKNSSLSTEWTQKFSNLFIKNIYYKLFLEQQGFRIN